MKTFSFPQLPPLRDFQFLTDSSGLVLTQAGQLYRFTGQKTQLVETPATFKVSHFYFLDATHGAIIGNARPLAAPLQKGMLGAGGLPLLLLLWLAWHRFRHSRKSRQLLNFGSCLLLGGGLVFSCSPAWLPYRTADPASPYASILTSPPLHQKYFHTYFANKGQESFIARTQDQGRTWETQSVPTNFYLTALTAIGRNFLVGSYANEEAGTIPLHGDGDVYIYGTDATFTSELVANSPQHPYGLSVSRGIKGFFVSTQDSTLFIFGSDRMPTVPSTAASATAGNIYALPLSLHPNVRLIDVPDTVDVLSLSQSGTGDLWATLADRKPHLSHGNLGYVALPTKKLLCFKAGHWQVGPLASTTSFRQIAFIEKTPMGYALTEQGALFETRNNGEVWQHLPVSDVRTLHAKQGAITWLKEYNQLIYYQPTTNR